METVAFEDAPDCFRDQRPSFSRLFWMGLEVGFKTRRLLVKPDHHSGCFFV
jgi:hypothetical protein